MDSTPLPSRATPASRRVRRLRCNSRASSRWPGETRTLDGRTPLPQRANGSKMCSRLLGRDARSGLPSPDTAAPVEPRRRPVGVPGEDAVKKIVVGLGNPARATRRPATTSAGWCSTAWPIVSARAAAPRRGTRAATVRGRLGDDELVLVKPMTYMNLSGVGRAQGAGPRACAPRRTCSSSSTTWPCPSVGCGCASAAAPAATTGCARSSARWARRTSPACGSASGRPPRGAVEHVLGDFAHAEQRHLDAILDAAADAVESWARGGTRTRPPTAGTPGSCHRRARRRAS